MADNQPDRDERPKMTTRVYTMAHDGIVTARRAIVTVLAAGWGWTVPSPGRSRPPLRLVGAAVERAA
ncbi:hypothetical protein SAZ11_35165 [Streptomyces sp. FXJ1.4098]|nr:hypothetical protein [Streptomyces sp. FXJ1.4098]